MSANANFLQRVKAFNLVPKNRDIFTLKTETTCEKALQLFQQHVFLAAPLIDEMTGRFVCFIEVSDLICYFLRSIKKEWNEAQQQKSLQESFSSKLWHVFEFMKESKRIEQECVSVSPTSPAMEVIEKFSKGDIYRVACLDDSHRIINLITHTDVLKFFANNSSLLNKRDQLPIRACKLLGRPVQQVKEDSKTLDVLRHLFAKNIHAVPVVNESGAVIATFSRSDMKYLKADYFDWLQLSVTEYHKKRIVWGIENLPPDSIDYQHFTLCGQPMTCADTDSLDYAMCTMLARNIHRLWIVDQKNVPIGVVTEADVMRGMLEPFDFPKNLASA